jgi:hypothetical protein
MLYQHYRGYERIAEAQAKLTLKQRDKWWIRGIEDMWMTTSGCPKVEIKTGDILIPAEDWQALKELADGN